MLADPLYELLATHRDALRPVGIPGQLINSYPLRNGNHVFAGLGLTAHAAQPLSDALQVQQTVALPQTGQFVIAAPFPFFWMPNNPDTDHVQVDALHAVPGRASTVDQRAMVSIPPKRTPAALAQVVPFGELPCQLLHHLANGVRCGRFGQQVRVIRGQGLGKKRHTKLLQRGSQTPPLLGPHHGQTEQEFPVMTTLRQMIKATRLDVPIGPRHNGFKATTERLMLKIEKRP